MTWVKVDGSFHGHPKVQAAGNAAVGLYICLASWLAQNQQTDTLIAPRRVVHNLGTRPQIRRMLAAGLATKTKADDGYVLARLFTTQRSDVRTRIPQYIRDEVFLRDDNRCVACLATDDLTLDHIHPWSLGGPDTETNLRVLCRSCNSSKGAKA